MNVLLEPFSYEYMLNAMWSAGDGRRSLRFPVMLSDAKGWSLIGDALSHSIVPGVAGHICWGFRFLWEPSFPADWLQAACCFLTNAPA